MSGPRVSIGLPVYNGARYLRTALDSLLAQTYTDFDIIISDNASTDQTESICREYAQRDVRIRYYRQEKNLGASPNFNHVFELSNSPYFKWAAHDDIYAPTYLEKCVEILDAQPDVMVAHSQAVIIDEAGARIAVTDTPAKSDQVPAAILRSEVYDPADRRLDSGDIAVRFHDLLIDTHWCFEIFGVMRREHLLQTRLHLPFYGSDKVLLSQLLMKGRFVLIPDGLFFRRYHDGSSNGIQSAKARETWMSTRNRSPIVFPRFRCMVGYLQSVLEHPLPLATRVKCLATVLRWAFQVRKWKKLVFRNPRPAPASAQLIRKDWKHA